MKKISIRRHVWTVLAILTAILVTVSSIIVKQSFLRIYPLYVSVFIMLLMSKMNRYAYLIGCSHNDLHIGIAELG